MNKLLILLTAFLAAFPAEARYVRKIKEPDFFIPAQDRMHKPEKLPPLSTAKPESDRQVFGEIPVYKMKFRRYLANMAVFANSGSFPEDKELEADMAVFANGDVFEVTAQAPQKITSKEQMNFYRLVDRIVKN